MRTKLLVFYFSALLFSAIAGTQVAKVTGDTWFPYPLPPPPLIISIQSPIGGGRYTLDNVSLTFTVKVPPYPGYNFPYPHGDMQYIGYSLNGQSKKYISPVTSNKHQYSVTVKELSEGWNNITIIASCEYLSKGSASVLFHVDSVAPKISVLSPQNDDYYSNDILLTFIISEQAEWIGYCLDGQTNVTITGNTTLSQLFHDLHNLIVYAEDKAGHFGISETVYFSIVEENPDFPNNDIPEFPSWTPLLIMLVAVLAVTVVYRRKLHN